MDQILFKIKEQEKKQNEIWHELLKTNELYIETLSLMKAKVIETNDMIQKLQSFYQNIRAFKRDFSKQKQSLIEQNSFFKHEVQKIKNDVEEKNRVAKLENCIKLVNLFLVNKFNCKQLKQDKAQMNDSKKKSTIYYCPFWFGKKSRNLKNDDVKPFINQLFKTVTKTKCNEASSKLLLAHSMNSDDNIVDEKFVLMRYFFKASSDRTQEQCTIPKQNAFNESDILLSSTNPSTFTVKHCGIEYSEINFVDDAKSTDLITVHRLSTRLGRCVVSQSCKTDGKLKANCNISQPSLEFAEIFSTSMLRLLSCKQHRVKINLRQNTLKFQIS